MDAETLKALNGSIEKWRKIVDGHSADEGVANCPLCHLFRDEDCVGCPVSEVTGKEACKGSPYDRWYNLGGYKSRADTQERLDAAIAELDFLLSLRPEEEASS